MQQQGEEHMVVDMPEMHMRPGMVQVDMEAGHNLLQQDTEEEEGDEVDKHAHMAAERKLEQRARNT
jgi:hypothetical protein